MPKRIVEFFVIDILVSIDKVKRYSNKVKTAEEFASNEMIFDATIRELELIGEALKRILDSSAYKHLAMNHWRIIVDFRNVLAHEYFGINYVEIFNIIRKDLIDFEKEFLQFTHQVDRAELKKALTYVKEELRAVNRTESVKHLDAIEKKLFS